MRTFLAMFIFLLIILMGACAKQAPKNKVVDVTVVRFIAVCDADYDPQGFDEEDNDE